MSKINLKRLPKGSAFEFIRGREEAYLKSWYGVYLNSNYRSYAIELPKGHLIGYKKVYLYTKLNNNLCLPMSRKAVLKMLIPADAQRICGRPLEAWAGYKCRASCVVPIAVLDYQGNEITLAKNQSLHSMWDDKYVYELGELMKPDRYSKNTLACSNGIHFFSTFKEAFNY